MVADSYPFHHCFLILTYYLHHIYQVEPCPALYMSVRVSLIYALE